MVRFWTRMLCQTKYPPVQRQSVGQGTANFRSPNEPRGCYDAAPSRPFLRAAPRETEILENWKTDHRARFPVSRRSPVGNCCRRGDDRPQCRAPSAITPPASPRPQRRPLSHAAGSGISSVPGESAAPPAARGKPGGHLQHHPVEMTCTIESRDRN